MSTMKEDLLRKRGWSLASEGTTEESVFNRTAGARTVNDSTSKNDNANVDNFDISASLSDEQNNDDVSSDQKKISYDGADEKMDGEASSNKRRRLEPNICATKSDDYCKSDEGLSNEVKTEANKDGENVIAGTDSGDEDITEEKLNPQNLSNGQKRESLSEGHKISDKNDNKESSSAVTNTQSHIKLSKLAARLFDPNRPRGVIEPPEIIPQNDEFLKEFGLREKELKSSNDKEGKEGGTSTLLIDSERHALYGKFEKNNLAVQDIAKRKQENDKNNKSNNSPKEGSKVKIMNLKYTTKEETIRSLMDLYGTIIDFKLIMDTKSSEGIRNNLSIGKAYCTFSTPDEADNCVEKLQEYKLDGRPLRFQVVPNDPRKERAAQHGGVAGALMMGGGVGGGSLLSRYRDESDPSDESDCESNGKDRRNSVSKTNTPFVTDLRLLAMKCRRCGKIGHAESSCSNPLQEKPCVLCAKLGHVGPKDCPAACVCFNCGVPGHAARDCPDAGRSAKRMICGMCFVSGHHRWQCPVQQPTQIEASISDALCMNCGSTGHFSCVAARWKYNVTQRQSATGGFSCFNCGEFGHHGASCARPKVDVCSRNQQVVQNELLRAESWVDQIERHYMSMGSNRSDRTRNRDRRNSGSGNRRDSSNSGRRDSSGGSGNRRDSSGGSGHRRDSKGYKRTNSHDDGRGRSSGYQDSSRRQRSRTQPPPTSRRY